MKLTPQQQALLDGAQGEVMAKVVETRVMYGETFNAARMVPVTSRYGHTVISFGLGIMKPVYELYDKLISAGLTAGQKFTADPRPMDPAVPAGPIEKLVFKKFMYSRQAELERQLEKLGLTGGDDYTCTCYLEQVGNTPARGEVLSWAESSAVVYANSVLGARCIDCLALDHVSHGAVRARLGHQHGLGGIEQLGALAHKLHAAQHDGLLRQAFGELCQVEAVADVISHGLHLGRHVIVR